MEPVSAIAGITIATGTSLQAITNLVNRIQDGPRHVRELSEDIHHLETFLQHAEEVLRVDGISDSVVSGSARDLIRTIQALNRDLEQLCRKVKKGQNPQDTDEIQRLKWYFSEKKCHKIQVRIKHYRDELSRSIELINLDYVRGLVKDVRSPQVLGLSTKVEESINREAEAIHNGESQSSVSLMHPISPPTSPKISNLAQNDRQSSFGSDTTLIPTRSAPGLFIRPTEGRDCGMACRCKCHIKITRQWPQVLQSSSASDIIGMMSRPSFVHRCSDRTCKARQGVRVGAVYITPPWLRRKAVSISILLQGLKIERHLRSHSIVAESSDVVRYAIKGDINGLRRLFSQRAASVHDSTLDGWSLLHCAAYYGQSETAKFLLQNSADVHASEIKSRKAAHLEVCRSLRKDASESEKLLAKMFPNADEFKSDFGLSPVHIAVLDLYDSSQKEKPELGELLDFVDDANNASPGEDWSAWRRKYQGRSSLFTEIIESFQYPSKRHKPGTKVFRDLKNEPDSNHGWSPIHWAAFTGRYEQWRILLDRGAYPYTITLSGRNMFHQAAEAKSVDIIAHLIDSGYHKNSLDINRPDIWGETPLHISSGKSAKCVSLLLNSGANENALQMDNQVPLHFAKFADGEERIEIVRMLSADRGDHINVRDAGGRTPIFDLLDSPECVTCLLDRGAKADTLDLDGKTLLHHASRENQPDTLQILLAHCPNLVSAKDKKGRTPLIEAFDCAAPRCVMSLLTHHPSASYSPGPDRPDWSLMHYAAHLGDADVLRHVLALPNMDLHARTKHGQSATDVAVAAGTYAGQVKELLMELSKAEGMLKVNLAGKVPTKGDLKAKYK